MNLKIIRETLEALHLNYNTKQATLQYYYRAIDLNNQNLDPLFLFASSISLASKATNSFRKQRDIINVIYYLSHNTELDLNEKYWKLKDTLVIYEDLLLRILNYNLDFLCLYSALSNRLISLDINPFLAQIAFAILNDLIYSSKLIFSTENSISAVFHIINLFLNIKNENNISIHVSINLSEKFLLEIVQSYLNYCDINLKN